MAQNPGQVPFEAPSGKQILMSVIGAAAVAGIVLVAFVLPAEYGMDPTGVGRMLGLTSMTGQTGETIEITDVIGGNEQVREVEIPDFGEPVPLPNPEIYQSAAMPPKTDTVVVDLPAESETEIKAVLATSKVITFSWETDRGTVYSDFHGHDPELGDDFWVRYREHQEGSGDNGSLVAPFAGEHGWYWLNYNDYPVQITLKLSGFYDDIINYGVYP